MYMTNISLVSMFQSQKYWFMIDRNRQSNKNRERKIRRGKGKEKGDGSGKIHSWEKKLFSQLTSRTTGEKF